ncbi:MAG: stage II sporulation protein D [Oscillospiraceae bacterium]|nr:stage II sporulation protein D [Oscillospiraceae bacterium]
MKNIRRIYCKMKRVLHRWAIPVMLFSAAACFALGASVRYQTLQLQVGQAPPVSQPPAVAAAHAIDEQQTVELLVGETVQTMSMRDYLIAVVFSEMPPSFPAEALKAQAVAARTFTMKRIEDKKHDGCMCTNSGCCQSWTAPDALTEKYGDHFAHYYDLVENAVLETDGEIVEYEGRLIDATYFSCSGGETEDAVAVWGSSVPYLVSVDSPGEEDAPHYFDQTQVPLSLFLETLAASVPGISLEGRPASWFSALSASDGGTVTSITVGGVMLSGSKIRALFGLPSAAFTVSVSDDSVIFTSRGYGHRVGMSQYGARAMAKDGADYREILQHYYSGVKIKTLSQSGTASFSAKFTADSEQRSE